MHTPLAYHASHEQFPPSQLLRWAVRAEAAGFDAIHCSDHFFPWTNLQGQSGFSFSWLGAAMQATKLPFSVICAPGGRYHPAMIAQATATLCELFPGRFSIELGSGEALNEAVVGKWPSKTTRNTRLQLCEQAIRLLLEGREITMEGLVEMNRAKLFTLPKERPPIFIAAVSEETAARVSDWSEGLLTTASTPEEADRKIKAYAGDDDSRPVLLQYSFSFAPTKEEALESAYQYWTTILLEPEQLAELKRPEQFEAATAHITREDMSGKVPLFTSWTELEAALIKFEHPNVRRIILHNLHHDHDYLFDAFERKDEFTFQ